MGGGRGVAPIPRRGPLAREGPVGDRWRWTVGVASERRTGGKVRGGPRVVVLAYPGADLLDVAGPCAVFDAFEQAPGRSEEDTTPGYSIEVVSTGGGSRVETSCRVALIAERDYLSVRGRVDTLLVAGGD